MPAGLAGPVPGPDWVEVGVASWYGDPYHGRTTASGEVYDMEAMTAAHQTLPFGTVLSVWNLDNGLVTTVRVNDRGPFWQNRIVDLSRHAARELDMIGPGTARVRLTIVAPAMAAGP
jgi:rare lipoprotein A